MADIETTQLKPVLQIECDLPDGMFDNSNQGSGFNVIVVIPAYNEARFIGSTVLKALNYANKVLVLDDGSEDDTSQLAEAAGAIVIRHDCNLGKGAALNTGLLATRPMGADCVVTLDADGQHLPEEIHQIIAPIKAGKADLVIGSRYLEKHNHVPRTRLWGHKFFNTFTKLSSGVQASDSQSGFRAYSPTALESICFTSQGFSVESEMQFLAREKGLVIDEVPITIRYPDGPKRSLLVHGVQVLNGILRLVGQHRPLFFFGIFGAFSLALGILWGCWVVKIYINSVQLAVGYTLVSILFSMVGIILLSTGFVLHSVRGLINDLLNSSRRDPR
jgi:glycosyltransferase involved in cell wall biosynthesis